MSDPNHFITEMPETEEELLAYTQRIRLTQINKIMGADVDVTDNKTQGTLEKFLKGVDGQIQGNRRIAAQEKVGDGIADLASSLDAYFKANSGESGGFKRHDGEDTAEVSAGPKNDFEIPTKEFIEGQLTPSGAEIDIDEIMASGIERQRQGD